MPKIDRADLVDLWTEPHRSSRRFKLVLRNKAYFLIDRKSFARKGETTQLHLSSDRASRLLQINLLRQLVEVANFRVDTFDHLLNMSEFFSTLANAFSASFPDLKSSALLEPLTDLKHCLHQLVCNRTPGIIRNRDRLFDGGMRWLETYDEAQRLGEKYRVPSDKPVRTWADIQNAKIALAYEALHIAFGDEKHFDELLSTRKMNTLLKEANIQHFDEDKKGLLETSDILGWRKKNGEFGEVLGMRFSWMKLKELHEHDLAKCGDKNYAVAFAAEIIEGVRLRQPSRHPKPDGEVQAERAAHYRRLKADSV